jgi:hypothetical protein
VISKTDQRRLLATLEREWDTEVASSEFKRLCRGKERGHRIADRVEERTVEFIRADGFPVAFQHGLDKKGPSDRSMGDIWLLSGSPPIYNPINVKAGIASGSGQPNMVALEKLTKAILNHEIDSYWLLLIRIDASLAELTASMMLINIFDYLDLMAFDSGPGQLMLRSKLFYDYIQAGGKPSPLTLSETVRRLVEIRHDGDARLFQNRRRKLAQLKKKEETFDAERPVDQSNTRLHPPED